MSILGYLQHGTAPQLPLRTETVRVVHEYADRYLAFFEGKWRRVHIGTQCPFIIYYGNRIPILIEGV